MVVYISSVRLGGEGRNDRERLSPIFKMKIFMKSKHAEIQFCPNPDAIMVHTNFDITMNPALKLIIEGIAGIESIDTWGCHKYNFLVIAGSMFDKKEIAATILEKIQEFRK